MSCNASAYSQSCTLENPAVLYAGTTTSYSTVVGHVAASTASTPIPAGVQSWSLTIVGTAGSVNGTALDTGTTLSGVGPTSAAITLTTGSDTTINYSYTI